MQTAVGWRDVHGLLHIGSNLVLLQAKLLSALTVQFSRRICHLDGSDKAFRFLEGLSGFRDTPSVSLTQIAEAALCMFAVGSQLQYTNT
jgi:hypothetical protein